MSASAIYAMPDPASEPDRIAELEARVSALEAKCTHLPGAVTTAPPPKRQRKDIDPKKCPTVPESLALAAIFRRRPETQWSGDEITAYSKLMRGKALHVGDVELIHRYFTAERARGTGKDGREMGIHRRDLLTLLNNYTGELDRAREWAARNQKAAQRPLSNGSAPKPADPEPAGFREWFVIACPKADPKHRWSDIPTQIKQQHREETKCHS